MTQTSEFDTALLAKWQEASGREKRATERLDPVALTRFAFALGGTGDADASTVPLAHWAFFLPLHDDADIGPDGHPKRGTFLPDIALPRRMFAASEMRFHEPLLIDAPAEQVSTIGDITHKQGGTGDLVFLRLHTQLRQERTVRVEETRTFVYRGDGPGAALPEPASTPPDGEIWQPDEVNLFRFSAATGNSHRIHYDAPYTTGVEKYPAIVVHGPFTAARLAGLAMTHGDLASFEFRAKAPLFVGQPIYLQSPSKGTYRAIRCDGTVSMEARASFR